MQTFEMEKEMLRTKREMFRVEIRRKQTETIFNQKRRQYIQQFNLMEEENNCSRQNKIVPIRPKYSVEHFSQMLQKLDLDEDTLQVLKQIIQDVQYQLDNGMYVDFLQWAGPVDIVQTFIEAMMSLFPQSNHFLNFKSSRSQQLAEQASKCFQQIVALPSKKIKTLLKDHVEKAIEIYKLWFLDDDENLQRNALKGLETLFISQEGVPGFKVPTETIDQVLSLIHNKMTSEKIKMKLYNLLGSSSQYIENEEKVIQVLKIAQQLVESNQTKKMICGLKLIENIAKNESNAGFVIGMGAFFKTIIDFLYYKERNIQQLSVGIMVQITCSKDAQDLKKLIELGVLDSIYTLLKDGKRSQNRQNAAIMLSNLMLSTEDVLDDILSHKYLVPQILVAMESETLQIRKELYFAWTNFIQCANRQNVIDSLCQGILSPMVLGLEKDCDSNIIILALKFIENVLIKISGNFNIEVQVKQFLIQQGITANLLVLQNHKSQEVYKLVNQIIVKHFSDDFQNE